jgi:hypothetical protein
MSGAKPGNGGETIDRIDSYEFRCGLVPDSLPYQFILSSTIGQLFWQDVQSGSMRANRRSTE